MDICPVCKEPVDRCVCCPECGHVCQLDIGESYCPVCSPKPEGKGVIKPGAMDEKTLKEYLKPMRKMSDEDHC